MKNKEQRQKYWRDRYKNDPIYRAKQLANRKKNKKLRVPELKVVFKEWRKDGCVLCKEKEISCLVAHHKDPTQKEHSISQIANGARVSVETFKAELYKCVCLCHNCHSKLHAGVLGRNLDLSINAAC